MNVDYTREMKGVKQTAVGMKEQLKAPWHHCVIEAVANVKLLSLANLSFPFVL